MKYQAFERRAAEAFESIPERFRAGVEGIVVSRESHAHPELPDVFTLGSCDTEDYPSDWVGPDTHRSVVVLYYGSFRALARLDPDFEWEAEIQETVEHEVRHHLESLAGEGALEDVDYAMDEGFKRLDGLDFDPWYYQSGEPRAGGVYVVEDQVFIEQEWTSSAFEVASRIGFEWDGRAWEVERPSELGDLHFVLIDGLGERPPSVELVLVRRRSWWEDARRLFSTTRPRVLESDATARPGAAGPPPGA